MGKKDFARTLSFFGDAAKADPGWAAPHLALAGMHDILHEYREVAEECAKALEVDDAQKQLWSAARRNTFNLEAVALALSGQVDRAFAAFHRGLGEFPDDSLLHYNLACEYAESGDLDNALPELKTAWEKRAGLPHGVKFPNPRKDSSFKRYLGNPKFEDAVRGMK